MGAVELVVCVADTCERFLAKQGFGRDDPLTDARHVEGGFTRHLPSGEQGAIYDVAMRYAREGTPLVILAGAEYGSGSSRDWAAKGPQLQGVRAVIAESFERIHRSNLVGMGVLPLQLRDGDTIASLELDGTEVFDVEGLERLFAADLRGGRVASVVARRGDVEIRFEVTVRVDTPQEVACYQHGGILPYVLRQLLAGREEHLRGGGASGGPAHGRADGEVDEAIDESFPASDPPTF